MPFTPVGAGAGADNETRNSYVNPAEMLGHLILIWPVEYETDTYTKYPRKDGQPSDAVYADVVDLNLPDELNQPGKVMRRVKWTQGRLIRDTKHAVGVGRDDAMLSLMSKNGDAFELVDQVHNQQAVQFASGWLAAHPQFQPGQDQPAPRQPEPRGQWGQVATPAVMSTPQPTFEESAMDRLRRQAASGNPYVPSTWTPEALPPPYPQQQDNPPF